MHASVGACGATVLKSQVNASSFRRGVLGSMYLVSKSASAYVVIAMIS